MLMLPCLGRPEIAQGATGGSQSLAPGCMLTSSGHAGGLAVEAARGKLPACEEISVFVGGTWWLPLVQLVGEAGLAAALGGQRILSARLGAANSGRMIAAANCAWIAWRERGVRAWFAVARPRLQFAWPSFPREMDLQT